MSRHQLATTRVAAMTFADLSGALGRVGLRLGERPAESSGRFSDGGRYRIEIPS